MSYIRFSTKIRGQRGSSRIYSYSCHCGYVHMVCPRANVHRALPVEIGLTPGEAQQMAESLVRQQVGGDQKKWARRTEPSCFGYESDYDYDLILRLLRKTERGLAPTRRDCLAAGRTLDQIDLDRAVSRQRAVIRTQQKAKR